MAFLAEKNIVHRDLALRNLLVAPSDCSSDRWLVKVSDFGLSRSMVQGFYRSASEDARIPVRWCAPEVFRQGLNTAKVRRFFSCSFASSLSLQTSAIPLSLFSCVERRVGVRCRSLGDVQLRLRPLRSTLQHRGCTRGSIRRSLASTFRLPS